MKQIKIFLTIACFCILSNTILADVNFTAYTLGMSFNQAQEQLIKDKFIFTKFNDKEFIARKLIVNAQPNPNNGFGKEYTELVPSTEIHGKFCDNKLYKLRIDSYYMKNLDALLLGRKNIYSYIEDNNGILEKLNISQNEIKPNVGLVFIIDRSESGGKIKGEERITTLLGKESQFLKMTFGFENKWFCPE